jgi:hypothetical protein
VLRVAAASHVCEPLGPRSVRSNRCSCASHTRSAPSRTRSPARCGPWALAMPTTAAEQRHATVYGVNGRNPILPSGVNGRGRRTNAKHPNPFDHRRKRPLCATLTLQSAAAVGARRCRLKIVALAGGAVRVERPDGRPARATGKRAAPSLSRTAAPKPAPRSLNGYTESALDARTARCGRACGVPVTRARGCRCSCVVRSTAGRAPKMAAYILTRAQRCSNMARERTSAEAEARRR